MSPAPPPKQTPQQVTSNLIWKLNNLETKVRINEQNIVNDRRHVQILNSAILELKQEMRDKVDTVLHDKHDLKKKVANLEIKVEGLERKLKRFVKKEEVAALQKFHQNFNYFDTDMTKDEADKILDNIVKKSEEK